MRRTRRPGRTGGSRPARRQRAREAGSRGQRERSCCAGAGPRTRQRGAADGAGAEGGGEGARATAAATATACRRRTRGSGTRCTPTPPPPRGTSRCTPPDPSRPRLRRASTRNAAAAEAAAEMLSPAWGSIQTGHPPLSAPSEAELKGRRAAGEQTEPGARQVGPRQERWQKGTATEAEAPRSAAAALVAPDSAAEKGRAPTATAATGKVPKAAEPTGRSLKPSSAGLVIRKTGSPCSGTTHSEGPRGWDRTTARKPRMRRRHDVIDPSRTAGRRRPKSRRPERTPRKPIESPPLPLAILMRVISSTRSQNSNHAGRTPC